MTQPGRVRLRVIDIVLVCAEEATFRQGTDIRSESRVVYQQRLLRKRGVVVEPNEPFQTDFTLRVPNRAMHSFHAANNKVTWQIVVQCLAKGWPEFRRVFPVLTCPPSQPAIVHDSIAG